MRFANLAIVGLPLLLAGCGLPPAIIGFSYVMDGFSYASSGKGVTDHALSAAIDRDCAMFRAVQGKDICRENDPAEGETAIAAVPDKFGTTNRAADDDKVAEKDALAGSYGIVAGSGISSGRSNGAEIGASGDLTLINPDQFPVKFNSTDGHPDIARLMNFPESTEIFALLQDDGALEIFVYGAGPSDSSRELALIATYENYSDNPIALKGVSIGGAFHAIGDLIV